MTITFNPKVAKVKKRQVWHKKFVIFPKRTRLDQLQFLTYVGRKLRSNYSSGLLMCMQYEYKSIQQVITDKLMGKED